MRIVRFALLLFLAVPAFAGWFPELSPSRVDINVGEYASVYVTPRWNGFTAPTPYPLWRFYSGNDSVALVVSGGRIQGGGMIVIRGVSAGVTELVGTYYGGAVVINVSEPEPPRKAAKRRSARRR